MAFRKSQLMRKMMRKHHCLCSAALWAASVSLGMPCTDTNPCQGPWWLSAAWTRTPVWESCALCFPKYYLFADFGNHCLCSLVCRAWDSTSRSGKYVCLALQGCQRCHSSDGQATCLESVTLQGTGLASALSSTGGDGGTPTLSSWSDIRSSVQGITTSE